METFLFSTSMLMFYHINQEWNELLLIFLCFLKKIYNLTN